MVKSNLTIGYFSPVTKYFFLLLAALALAASPARALETQEDADGTLNAQELTLEYFARKADASVFDPLLCFHGYIFDKMGDHKIANRIFERCAAEGVMAALPWLAWEEENGYVNGSNPEKAAEWDRKAAEAGYSIGQFNYGLDLLRGRGVSRDVIRGRALIDRAATQGDTAAQELARQGYDPESVTPEADKQRYRKPMF